MGTSIPAATIGAAPGQVEIPGVSPKAA